MHDSTSHRHIELLAYRYWELRGRPCGSPEVDWFRAIETLRAYPAPNDVPLSAIHTKPDE